MTEAVEPESGLGRDRPGIPYLSFETFRNFIDGRAGRPLPPRVDRSLMIGMAGGTQTHLMGALSTFGLIGENRQVTPRFAALARLTDAERPAFFGDLLRAVYPQQVALADTHATADQLAESFRELTGYQGSTLRKAITFFLNMARYAEVPLSPYFRAPAQASMSSRPRSPRKTATPSPRPATAARITSVTAPDSGATTASAGAAESRIVELQSGGTVTVACSTSFLSLSRRDREFVFNLVDQLMDYQERANASADSEGVSRSADVTA